jgi:hypothetical protein
MLGGGVLLLPCLPRAKATIQMMTDAALVQASAVAEKATKSRRDAGSILCQTSVVMSHADPLPEDFRSLSLGDIQGTIWSLLSEGVRDASSPFHTPALATASEDGADVRTVVLRHADSAAREISCHTDWRSDKRLQIDRCNRVAWMFYSRERRVQLRLRGRAILHNLDRRSRDRWSRSPARSRVCYATPLAPGTPVERPSPAPDDGHGGWPNFTVLVCEVAVMDFLFLSAAGHRRALLQWQGDAWEAGWIAP